MSYSIYFGSSKYINNYNPENWIEIKFKLNEQLKFIEYLIDLPLIVPNSHKYIYFLIKNEEYIKNKLVININDLKSTSNFQNKNLNISFSNIVSISNQAIVFNKKLNKNDMIVYGIIITYMKYNSQFLQERPHDRRTYVPENEQQSYPPLHRKRTRTRPWRIY
jgi:hypothetical protein